MRIILTLGVVAGLLLAYGCGGGSEAAEGESCDESGGQEGVCEEGTICGAKDNTGTLECLLVCVDQSDCPADEECNGIEGSNVKGCRDKV